MDLHKEDREFTTFITPWGRYRYIAAPQGWLASGNAYTHRYDFIAEGVENYRRVVDDCLLYDKDTKSALFTSTPPLLQDRKTPRQPKTRRCLHVVAGL